MPGWGVIPSIRVRDMAEALAFYIGQLEFTLDSGGEGATNSSLTRGDGHLMIETAADFYGDQYNEAIRERLGTRSSIALYIEAEDLAAFHSRLKASGTVRIIDPLAARPNGQEDFTVEDPAGNWLTFWRKPG
ncbi:MAG: VOC family protein [Gaiellaceae bacterium]